MVNEKTRQQIFREAQRTFAKSYLLVVNEYNLTPAECLYLLSEELNRLAEHCTHVDRTTNCENIRELSQATIGLITTTLSPLGTFVISSKSFELLKQAYATIDAKVRKGEAEWAPGSLFELPVVRVDYQHQQDLADSAWFRCVYRPPEDDPHPRSLTTWSLTQNAVRIILVWREIGVRIDHAGRVVLYADKWGATLEIPRSSEDFEKYLEEHCQQNTTT